METKDIAQAYDRDFLRSLMVKMMTVRKFEEKLQWLFAQGLIYGTMHPGIGEEATGIGTTAALKKDDYMLATHRGHGEVIGKGVNIDHMMAEILARDTGTNRGKGGSMHIADLDNGILGANGIVAANMPLVCGAALTIMQKKIPDRVALTFFGDGASNEGVFHEALNMASLWKLPIVYICENNGFGISVPVWESSSVKDISVRGAAYDMPGVTVDGNDVEAVDAAFAEAQRRALAGEGPTLIECKTYRQHGHNGNDAGAYRAPGELEFWKSRDPIRLFEESGALSPAVREELRAAAEREIREACAFAEASPYPAPDELMRDIFYGT